MVVTSVFEVEVSVVLELIGRHHHHRDLAVDGGLGDLQRQLLESLCDPDLRSCLLVRLHLE